MSDPTNKTPGDAAYEAWLASLNYPLNSKEIWQSIASAVLAHAAPKHDAEIARLKHLLDDRSRGIHSCSHLCERPLCVLGRENERLRAELASAKAVIEKLSPDALAIAAEWWRLEEMGRDFDALRRSPVKGLWFARFIGNATRRTGRPVEVLDSTPAAAIIAAHEAWKKEQGR